MEYKVGEVFYSPEVDGRVKCVEDANGQSCALCAFSEDRACGASCPAKSYDWHPCYHSDREDGRDVHFELA